MTAVQRQARSTIWRYGVDCEIALDRAWHASDQFARENHLSRAEALSTLAFALAPKAVYPRGAA